MKKLLVALLALGSASAMADSLWNHNGSVMLLEDAGQYRRLSYYQPSEKMRKAGVTRGTVLFEGKRDGNRYYGTSRVFSKWCNAPLEYAVDGYVAKDGNIVLFGHRQVFASGCVPTDQFINDKLVFTYLRKL